MSEKLLIDCSAGVYRIKYNGDTSYKDHILAYKEVASADAYFITGSGRGQRVMQQANWTAEVATITEFTVTVTEVKKVRVGLRRA